MKILWFTTRKRVDLCATTLDALGKGMVAKGHQLTIINSDEEGSHGDLPWNHVAILSVAMRGRKARVLGLNMRTWLSKLPADNENTIAIVDWRIATVLRRALNGKSIPWILMDRSPPADRGILARLQWPVWKKSWRLVKRNEAVAGCVVSQAHGEMVHSIIGVPVEKMTSIPAGVDVSLFHSGKKNELMTLVYHGRLDRHRGVLSLPIFQQKLSNHGIQSELILIGEGDAKSGLQRIAEHQKHLRVIDQLQHEELAEILARAHIGLLPMPETKVWSIASPLKRGEYAASGLMIYGIDHRGHRLEQDVQPSWIRLVGQEDFHEDGCAWIQSLTSETMALESGNARLYAEENLGWAKSVNELEALCQRSLNDTRID